MARVAGTFPRARESAFSKDNKQVRFLDELMKIIWYDALSLKIFLLWTISNKPKEDRTI